jgi:hypothetical protein
MGAADAVDLLDRLKGHLLSIEGLLLEEADDALPLVLR